MIAIKKIGNEITTHPEKVLQVYRQNNNNDITIFVVSAASGVTDLLYRFVEGFVDRKFMLEKFARLHNNYENIGIEIDSYVEYLKKIVDKGINRSEPDMILSAGEKIVSMLIYEILDKEGYRGLVLHPEELGMIISKTDKGNIYRIDTSVFSKISENIKNRLQDREFVIIPGFYAVDHSSAEHVMGRGSSDFTASIIHRAIDKSILFFYKEVGGIYEVDPELIKSRYIKNISIDALDLFSRYTGRMFYPFTFSILDRNSSSIKIVKSSGEAYTEIGSGSPLLFSFGYCRPPVLRFINNGMHFEISNKMDVHAFYMIGDINSDSLAFIKDLYAVLKSNGTALELEESEKNVVKIVFNSNNSSSEKIIIEHLKSFYNY